MQDDIRGLGIAGIYFHLFHHQLIIGQIAFLPSLVGQFCQEVGFKLDAVEFVVATQFLDFLFTIFARHGIISILIACELLVELFLADALSPLFLGTKAFRNREERHNGVVVNRINLTLVQNLQRVAQRLWHIREDLVHLGLRLKPLLFCIEHSRGVVQVLAR